MNPQQRFELPDRGQQLLAQSFHFGHLRGDFLIGAVALLLQGAPFLVEVRHGR